MIHFTLDEVKETFTEAIHRVQTEDERTFLQDRGRDVAVLISVKDLELLEQLEEQADLEEALKAMNDPTDEVVNWEDAQKELDVL